MNFVEAVREHKDPPFRWKSVTAAVPYVLFGNIACELKRTIKWDPTNQVFLEDTDGAATKLMHYEYRSRIHTPLIKKRLREGPLLFYGNCCGLQVSSYKLMDLTKSIFTMDNRLPATRPSTSSGTVFRW